MSMAEPAAKDTHRYTDNDLGTTEKTPNHRVDLRAPSPDELDRFIKTDQVRDWSLVKWKNVGKPFEVRKMSRDRTRWEESHDDTMSVKTSWEFFNRTFHEWFVKDMPVEMSEKRREMFAYLGKFDMKKARAALGESARLALWNYVHRVQDGIWDPRGKRALFEGLDVEKPRILFLGAAEGYEAMQLAAIYPGSEVTLVDYDEFCKTDRFGHFPESYPFLGTNPQTGGTGIWYKDQMNIEYVIDDIRNLSYGKEFDIVLSVGLIEHFPDEFKPEAMEWHRKFLKPGGYAILTTPRNQWKSRLYYNVMADVMNHTYRELMDVRQMGLYVYENGFEILRHGIIKVHNGIVARPR